MIDSRNYFCLGLGFGGFGDRATFFRTRSNLSESSLSAETSRAMSMKRLNCSGSSGLGLGFWGIPIISCISLRLEGG
jgi:hypothetical protein